ncbi:MAG: hypothetical protein HY784_18005, partial [Chloroflexi bacterium]|nr:hypothetical protein [Chloroflexota bacterium]
LISEYLRLLSTPKLSTQETPVLHRLTGILPTDVSTDAYHKHLVEKYDV